MFYRNPPDRFHKETPLPAEIIVPSAGEKKHVTVLISDLSGFTVLSQRLDPEELNELMGGIFGAMDKIISAFGGFIEKFMGDAVVAFFGVPAAHEDDPVRAVFAALDIHQAIASLRPQPRTASGLPLRMHSGISSGLVVTTTFNPTRGNYGISGDTINLAARLQALAQPGDILVCADTRRQSEGYFAFESLPPARVKGRSQLVAIHRVISARAHPRKLYPRRGLRSRLIGRRQEMRLLFEAADRLQAGTGSVIGICGEAGTGKSRLVDEFKSAMRHRHVQWYSGYAHDYSRNSSFAPLRELLGTMLEISKGDAAHVIRQKIRDKYAIAGAESTSLASFLGKLDRLDHREPSAADPEILKSRLYDAMSMLFSREAQRSPAVFCLEDIHWADPSSMEFIRTCADISGPALFLITFRPASHLFSGRHHPMQAPSYREIRLTNLTAEESRKLLESLLKPYSVPAALERFILEKVDGNPFYLEEMLHNLLESNALVAKKGRWQFTGPLHDLCIPRTVQGHVAARIDCLPPRVKRVLQVAAVAGKHFSRPMLAGCIDDPAQLPEHLELLERHDLIGRIAEHPHFRYGFRHDIIREVVYKSLLKKERRDLHQRLGMVMEERFTDSPDDAPEILAFHFKHGKSPHKAIRYLIQSAGTSLRQYAVIEAHRFYREAYDLLTAPGRLTPHNTGELIDLLNRWAPVFYFRGTFGELETLFRRHLPEADTLDDLEKRGIYHVWLGASLWGIERFGDAYRFLRKALELGAQGNSRLVNGYAHTWLAWTCVDLGRMKEGLEHGKEARRLFAGAAWEHYPYFQSFDSDGYAYWALGACARVRESGEKLLALGRTSSSIRGITWGNTVAAWGFMGEGDFSSAIERTKAALAASKDPLYTQFPRLSLGMCYVLCGEHQKAKELLEEVLEFARTIGCRYLDTPARCFLAVVLTAEGRFGEGMRMLTGARQWWAKNRALWRYTFSELIVGDIYSALALRTTPVPWIHIIKNGWFLAKTLPCAGRNAAHHYHRAIELAHRIGAGAIEGQAHLSLGRFHKARKEYRKAVECFLAARSLFKACEAGVLFGQAERELRLMEGDKKKSLRV